MYSTLLLVFVQVVAANTTSVSRSDHHPNEASDTNTFLQIDDAQVKLIQQVNVPARETGVLIERNVREGQLVSKGETLAQIDSELLDMEYELAKHELQMAQLQRQNDVDLRFNRKASEVAIAEWKRANEAIRVVPNAISKTEQDQLQLQVEKASLSVEQAGRDLQSAAIRESVEKQRMAIAQLRADRCQIRSPIDGMVVELIARSGEWVNPGEPILRIVQMDRLHVEAFVDWSRYGAGLKESAVTFTTSSQFSIGTSGSIGTRAEGPTFKGVVSFVSPEVHPVTGKIRVVADVENPDMTLRPGTRGTLRIETVVK